MDFYNLLERMLSEGNHSKAIVNIPIYVNQGSMSFRKMSVDVTGIEPGHHRMKVVYAREQGVVEISIVSEGLTDEYLIPPELLHEHLRQLDHHDLLQLSVNLD